MIDQNNLKIYKGVPITIVTALLLLKRNASAKELMRITGYSDKPVRDALAVLIEDHIVIKAGFGSYMLSAYQLPLSWSEDIERLPSEDIGVIPESIGETPNLFSRVEDLEARVLKLETAAGNQRNSEGIGETPILTGDIPNLLPEGTIGETPTVNGESPISIGETPNSEQAKVKELINKDSENIVSWLDVDNNQPTEKSNEVNMISGIGETPNSDGETPEAAKAAWKCAASQIGENPLLRGAVLISYEEGHFTVGLDSPHKVTPANGKANEALREKIEEILTMIMKAESSVTFVYEKSPNKKIEEKKYPASTLELLPMPKFETYKNQIRNTEICNEYLLDPVGINYRLDDLHVLISHGPDPEVLHFILRKATNLENAIAWMDFDLITVKRKLLKKYGIINGTAAKIAHNENATLEMIDKICTEAENTSLAIDRINKLSDEAIPEM